MIMSLQLSSLFLDDSYLLFLHSPQQGRQTIHANGTGTSAVNPPDLGVTAFAPFPFSSIPILKTCAPLPIAVTRG